MATWSLTVLLDGANITARLLGELEIDAERSAARVCSLYYRPAGSVAPRDLEGLTLTIDLTTNTAGTVRRFTGRVLKVKTTSETGVVWLMGADSFKGQANGASLATLQTWCPDGLYHEAIFGPRVTGWRQLQDLASTSGGTVECGPDDAPRANPLRVLGASPDVTFTKYLKGSLEEGSLDMDAVLNTAVLTLKWAYTRLWSRTHTLEWDWGLTDFCSRIHPEGAEGQAYHQNPWELPTVAEVQAFDGKAGWAFQIGRQGFATGDGVGFNPAYLPATGWYDCDPGGSESRFKWGLTEDNLTSLTHFNVTLERRGARGRAQHQRAARPQALARPHARRHLPHLRRVQ
jgi:hypothetical protein